MILKHCSDHDTQREEERGGEKKIRFAYRTLKLLRVNLSLEIQNDTKMRSFSFLASSSLGMSRKRTRRTKNNYLTGCPLRAQGESGWSISKKQPRSECFFISVPRCAYRGGSLFLRGLALPLLPPPLTGARSLVPRRLIGHRASSIPGAPPIAGSASAT